LHDKYISRNTYVETISVLHYQGNQMHLLNLIERLSEMFPSQDYPTRMEQYIMQHDPKSTTDVERHQRDFEDEYRNQGLL